MKNQKLWRTVLMGACVFVAVGAAPIGRAMQEPRSETEGIKETERFVKEGGDVAHAAGEAKNQVQSTLTAYNNLVSTPSKNMKSDYGKLLKEIKQMDEKAAAARTQVGEMESASKAYFAGRAGTIAKIEDPKLKGEAEERLTASQQQHANVLAALRSAGESLDPIRKQLADQVKYLGSDLNPTAAATLAPNAKKLNEEATKNFARTDQAIVASDTYFNSMRPSR